MGTFPYLGGRGFLRPSENWHNGEIAKSRDMAAVEAHWGRSWNTFVFSHRDLGMHWILSCKPHEAVIFELWIHKPNLQNGMRCNAMACIYQTSSKFLLSSFILSPAASCCLSLPLSISFGVAWSLSMSIGSYAQGLSGSGSGSGSVDLVVCSCSESVPALPCLSAFRPLCCFLDLPWFWFPGSHGIIPARMLMCFWLASC